jgi:hypothetical protein
MKSTFFNLVLFIFWLVAFVFVTWASVPDSRATFQENIDLAIKQGDSVEIDSLLAPLKNDLHPEAEFQYALTAACNSHSRPAIRAVLRQVLEDNAVLWDNDIEDTTGPDVFVKIGVALASAKALNEIGIGEKMEFPFSEDSYKKMCDPVLRHEMLARLAAGSDDHHDWHSIAESVEGSSSTQWSKMAQESREEKSTVPAYWRVAAIWTGVLATVVFLIVIGQRRLK